MSKRNPITAAADSLLTAAAGLTCAGIVVLLAGGFNHTAAPADVTLLQAEAIEAPTAETSVDDGSTDEVALFELQRDLVLSAIESGDRERNRRLLDFFSRIGLLPHLEERIASYIETTDVADFPSLADAATAVGAGETDPSGIVLAADPDAEVLRHVEQFLGPRGYLCTALAVSPTVVVLPAHCIGEDFAGFSVGGLPLPESPELQTVLVGGGNDSVSSYPEEELYSVVFVEVAEADYSAVPRERIRPPRVGEFVVAYGFARIEDIQAFDSPPVSMRSIARPRVEVVPYESRPCMVTHVDISEGTFSTTCVTGAGSSGSPIVAADDGAVVGVVAWGYDDLFTNGPVMATALERAGDWLSR